MRGREDLAWAAGLFDGEGYIGIMFQHPQRSPRLAFQIGQMNTQVLDRFCHIVGLGCVRGPYGKKQSYRFEVGSYENVQAIIAMLWNWLSPIKKAQATQVLNKYHKYLGDKRRFKRGTGFYTRGG